MTLQELIDQGDELKGEEFGSPLVELWQSDAVEAVEPYGEGALNALKSTFSHVMFMGHDSRNQANQAASVEKAQRLMRSLVGRPTRKQEVDKPTLESEAKTSLRDKLGVSNMTINGPVSFGDHSPANQIQIKEILIATLQQVEESLPDSPEKKSIVDHLTALSENPTFAAIAGSTLSAVLGGFLHK